MGTNYYVEQKPCPHCGRGGERLHIGKSSAGWVFALHVTEELPDLEHWLAYLAEHEDAIVDEYGGKVPLMDMICAILIRKGTRQPITIAEMTVEMVKNDAVPGPNNLWRAKLGGNVTAHGAGTWDCHTGEFS